MFLNEVEDIFEVMDPGEFVKVQEPLFQQLARCVSSQHFQVAERALYFWNNEYFCHLVGDNVETILPIMFAPLYENSKGHWNKTINSMVYNAMKLFMEMSPQLFDECTQHYQEMQSTAVEREQGRQDRWAKLRELAQQHKAGNTETSTQATNTGSDDTATDESYKEISAGNAPAGAASADGVEETIVEEQEDFASAGEGTPAETPAESTENAEHEAGSGASESGPTVDETSSENQDRLRDLNLRDEKSSAAEQDAEMTGMSEDGGATADEAHKGDEAAGEGGHTGHTGEGPEESRDPVSAPQS
ncbi:hypothetical protein KEM55_005780 [Ascosphaera atra]|nr:hypothetical protein KEM55_005780 [Ascosphaera atra]